MFEFLTVSHLFFSLSSTFSVFSVTMIRLSNTFYIPLCNQRWLCELTLIMQESQLVDDERCFKKYWINSVLYDVTVCIMCKMDFFFMDFNEGIFQCWIFLLVSKGYSIWLVMDICYSLLRSSQTWYKLKLSHHLYFT